MPKKARCQFPTELNDIEKLARFLCIPLNKIIKLERELSTRPESVARSFTKTIQKVAKRQLTLKERKMSEVNNHYKVFYSTLNRRLQKIELPPNFFGSTKGRSQKQNAALHVGYKNVYQIDIKDFFPSLRLRHLKALFIKLGATPKVASVLAKLTLFEGCLPQGFATSSTIANLFVAVFVYEPFIRRFPGKYTLSFTIDDISISSFKPIVEEDFRFLQSLVEKQGLKIHGGKTERNSPRESKLITGYRVATKLHASKQIIACTETDLHLLKSLPPVEIAKKQGPLYWKDKFDKALANKVDLGNRYLNRVKGKLAQIFSDDSKAAQRIHRRYKDILWKHQLVSSKQLGKAGISVIEPSAQ